MKLKKITLGLLGVAVIAAPIATVVSCGKKTKDYTIDLSNWMTINMELSKIAKEIRNGDVDEVNIKLIGKNETKTFTMNKDNGRSVSEKMNEFVKDNISI